MTPRPDASVPHALDEHVLRAVEPASPRSARQVTLVVVGPHPLVRWGLCRAIEHYPDLSGVGEAASADEALALCHMVRPDVVAVDTSLPDESSWRLITTLRASRPDLGIVVLAGDGSDRALFRALEAGASAFARKDAPITAVLAAIRGAAVAPTSFSAGGLVEAMRRRNERDERTALSRREREILFLLRDGLSVPEIAERLYVSLSTAKTYVARLYDKLGARNRAQALMAAVRDGFFDELDRPQAGAVGCGPRRRTDQPLAEKKRARLMTAGPSTTTNIAGSRQVMSGSSNLTCIV